MRRLRLAAQQGADLQAVEGVSDLGWRCWQKQSHAVVEQLGEHAANLFPNVTMVISPGNLQFVMFEPVGASRCIMHLWFYFVGDAAAAPEHEKARQMVYAGFATINAEDEGICRRLQEGRSCDAYDGGRLAPFWDDGTANFHRQIAAAIRGEGAFERPSEALGPS